MFNFLLTNKGNKTESIMHKCFVNIQGEFLFLKRLFEFIGKDEILQTLKLAFMDITLISCHLLSLS